MGFLAHQIWKSVIFTWDKILISPRHRAENLCANHVHDSWEYKTVSMILFHNLICLENFKTFVSAEIYKLQLFVFYTAWCITATAVHCVQLQPQKIEWGWLGRAMVLGCFQCQCVLLLWHIVGKGSAVLAASERRAGCSLIFSSCLSYLPFLKPHLETQLDILKYCSLGRYNPTVVVSYYRRHAR